MRILNLLLALLLLNGLHPGLAAAQTTNTSDRTSVSVRSPRNRDYQPITGPERINWFVNATVGPKSLAAGVASAGWGSALNNPEEYGPHWAGFAKRYGMRLTGVSTGNAIEAGLGRLWGEDPRYVPSAEDRSIRRFRHAAAMVFMAPRTDGRQAPAFARYAGIVGNNFISNTWRVSSESSISAALTRSALGFAGRFASNVFDEFWSDIHHKIWKR